MKPAQRLALGETLRELANFAAAARVFGQFVGQQPRSWVVILAGTAVWVGFVSVALVLEGE